MNTQSNRSYIDKVWGNAKSLKMLGINNRYLLDTFNSEAGCERKFNNRIHQQQRYITVPIRLNPRYDLIELAIDQLYSDLNAAGKFSLFTSRLGKTEYDKLTRSAFYSNSLIFFELLNSNSFDDELFLSKFTYKYKALRFTPSIFNLICAVISSNQDEAVLPNGVRLRLQFSTESRYNLEKQMKENPFLNRVVNARKSNPIPYWDFNDSRVFDVLSECLPEFNTFQTPFAQDLDLIDLAEIGTSFCVLDENANMLQMIVGNCDKVGLHSVGHAVAFGITSQAANSQNQNSPIDTIIAKRREVVSTTETYYREKFIAMNGYSLYDNSSIDIEVLYNSISRAILGYDSSHDDFILNSMNIHRDGDGSGRSYKSGPPTGGGDPNNPQALTSVSSRKGRNIPYSDLAKTAGVVATSGIALNQGNRLIKALNKNSNINSQLTKAIKTPGVSLHAGPVGINAKLPI